MTTADILKLIEDDPQMMDVLRQAAELNLPNWAVGGGFVRNKVWDRLHGIERAGVDSTDVDLVYFDPNGNDEAADEQLSTALRAKTGIDWEVVNQCYAHAWNNLPPYASLEQAMASWPETATGVGVRLEGDRLRFFAPHGIDDLVDLIVRPSPGFVSRPEVIRERAAKKHWLEKWPKLKLMV